MKINAFMPIIEFMLWGSIRMLKRILDSNCLCGKYRTKKITKQQFVDLYSGPDFLIHYRYSAMMNITFIAMFYGTGIPILYPVALLSFFIIYFLEKMLIFYYYKLPPMYDEKLSKQTLKMLPYSVILHVLVGYWMLSNRQMFTNDTFSVDTPNQPIVTGHIPFRNMKSDHSLLLFLLGLILCFEFFIRPIISYITTKYKRMVQGNANIGESMQDQLSKAGIEVTEENLDNYFNALSLNHTEWWVAEVKDAKNLVSIAFNCIRDVISLTIILRKN